MRPVTIIAAVLLTPLLTAASCGNTRPQLPEVVEVTVEVYRDLPDWATAELPKPQAKDGTVGAYLTSEDARGAVIDLANCHRRLLRKLDSDEAVDKRECEK